MSVMHYCLSVCLYNASVISINFSGNTYNITIKYKMFSQEKSCQITSTHSLRVQKKKRYVHFCYVLLSLLSKSSTTSFCSLKVRLSNSSKN